MKVLNFGSLNYDLVYRVDHIAMPGETITSDGMQTFCGGKGLNQSIALAKAGAQVYHAGMVGADGEGLLAMLRRNGADSSFVKKAEGKSGHAVIQIDKKGQNCIILFSGSNRQIPKAYMDSILTHFEKDDVLLLQNEINDIDYLVDKAYEKGMTIVMNPSPFDGYVKACALTKISVFLLNEVEGEQITGKQNAEDILKAFREDFPEAKIVLTLGKAGAVYQDSEQTLRHGIYSVPVVDTTAAGDTFTGYFLAAMLENGDMERALELASIASSIAVSRKGAAPSIPTRQEVLAFQVNGVLPE